MIAIPLADFGREVEVLKVMDSMLKVETTAEYYSMAGKNIILYYQDELVGDQLSYYYKINGKVYNTIGSGSLDYFKKEEEKINDDKRI